MAYSVYILQSQSTGRYYVGQTTDIARRLKEHNSGEVGSTSPHVPWDLMYREEFSTRSEAVRRERQIKGRKRRAFIESLVHSERGAAR